VAAPDGRAADQVRSANRVQGRKSTQHQSTAVRVAARRPGDRITVPRTTTCGRQWSSHDCASCRITFAMTRTCERLRRLPSVAVDCAVRRHLLYRSHLTSHRLNNQSRPNAAKPAMPGGRISAWSGCTAPSRTGIRMSAANAAGTGIAQNAQESQ